MDRFLGDPRLTEFGDALSLFLGRSEVFDEGEFGAGLELAEVDLIHEGADEEDAAAGAAEKVLGGKRIGKVFPVNALSLIRNGEDEGFAVVLEACCHLFGGVIVITVKDGINGGFADSHGDAEALIFVNTRFLSQLLCGSFNFAHALHRGGQRKAQFSGLRIGHRLRLRLYREWQSPTPYRERKYYVFMSCGKRRYSRQFHC